MTRPRTQPVLTRDQRVLVVKALRNEARRVKGTGLGKGDQRLLAARRDEHYREVNDLATAFERGEL